MKKIMFPLVVLLCCVPSWAQLVQGQHMVGGRLGLGFQLENSGISYTDQDRVNWGTLGAEYGLFYHYLITDNIGLGTDISYGDFEGGELFKSTDEVDDKTHLFNMMFSVRFTSNPASKFRLYMPIGLGITTAWQDIHIDKYDVRYDKKATDSSLSWFAGAGLEFDLGNEGWSMGLEVRYHAFRFDTEKITRNAPAAVQGDGNRQLSYLLFQLLVHKRF